MTSVCAAISFRACWPAWYTSVPARPWLRWSGWVSTSWNRAIPLPSLNTPSPETMLPAFGLAVRVYGFLQFQRGEPVGIPVKHAELGGLVRVWRRVGRTSGQHRVALDRQTRGCQLWLVPRGTVRAVHAQGDMLGTGE